MEIFHLGAEKDVTGSCHYLHLNDTHILIDCGMTQGNVKTKDMRHWPVHASEIDYLFITHAHIDHIGRIPELVRNGFEGEILTTHATKALMTPMLENAMALGFQDKRDRKKMIARIDDLTWGFEFNESFQLKKKISFTLGRAGHILGSCFVQIQTKDVSVVFSGDLGATDTPILCEPDIPAPCDILCLESTYGDHIHENRAERIQKLGQVLTHAVSDEGKVYIPSFSLGRTQEFLYEMDRIFSDPDLKKQFPDITKNKRIPVFLDSPLGFTITRLFSQLSKYWNKEAKQLKKRGDHPIDFKYLYTIENSRQHQKLVDMPGPSIIIAGSGMCTGGRILNHLQGGLPDWRNDILFIGYQASGTLGNEIIRFGKRTGGYVYIDNNRVDIKANIHIITGYSAHADQKGLLNWVDAIKEKPGKIKLIHGEPEAQNKLREKLLEKDYSVMA
ncbi:MAG: MBL fold metallo-hydrolase [Candidatus Magnetomorum sp.]|nr:MBL fold metallo-hydrolase [Candidatus Magnetomorum sp.]